MGQELQYAVVFDALRPPFSVYAPVIEGHILILVSAVAAFRPQWFGPLASIVKSWHLFGWAALIFSIFWTCLVFASINGSYTRSRQALESNQCQTVEGRVEHFHPMPWQGHDKERFDVNGLAFSYSDYDVTGGFNTSASHWGPIKEGLPVRICHIDGLILRLEVAR